MSLFYTLQSIEQLLGLKRGIHANYTIDVIFLLTGPNGLGPVPGRHRNAAKIGIATKQMNRGLNLTQRVA
jgi:hypothetical protein